MNNIDWKKYFNYDPETGILTWKERTDIHPSRVKQWNAAWAGKEVGSLGSGGRYLESSIKIDGKIINYKVHRVCYIIHNGPIPEGYEVDHVNHITTDNRAVNFELKTHRDNMRNQTKSKKNTSGHSGIHKNKYNKWVVRIGGGRRGDRKYLGCFDTLEEAIAVRTKAEMEYGYHENHGK